MARKLNQNVIQHVINTLNYDWTQYTFEHFVSHIEALRQRTLLIIPIPGLVLPGICAATPVADYILYDATDLPAAQQHHKLHEIGHFVLGHVQEVTMTDNLRQWMRDIFQKSQFRGYSHIYETDLTEEHEAECFAYLIEDHIARAKRLSELTGTATPTTWQIPPFAGDFAKDAS